MLLWKTKSLDHVTIVHIANSAGMTYAKPSHDWIAEIRNRANGIFTRFQLRAHKPFAKLAPDTSVYQLSAVDSGTLPTRKTPYWNQTCCRKILHKMTAGTEMINGNIKFKRVTCSSLIGTMVHCWDHWYEWLSVRLSNCSLALCHRYLPWYSAVLHPWDIMRTFMRSHGQVEYRLVHKCEMESFKGSTRIWKWVIYQDTLATDLYLRVITY